MPHDGGYGCTGARAVELAAQGGVADSVGGAGGHGSQDRTEVSVHPPVALAAAGRGPAAGLADAPGPVRRRLDRGRGTPPATAGWEAKTLFADLQRRYPGRFPDGQLRTFQRRVKHWRAAHGPAKEVFFAQVHTPGRLCASDFTHMTDLRVTIDGQPFDHLIYHFVLTYSNWETGTVCFAESFESLADGLQNALWRTRRRAGDAPHRPLTAGGPAGTTGSRSSPGATRRLLAHYGLEGAGDQGRARATRTATSSRATTASSGRSTQALMLRGSRDFASRDAYAGVPARAVRASATRSRERSGSSRDADPCGRCRRGGWRRAGAGGCGWTRAARSTCERNTYSVPSRLIGERVEVRVYAEHVEVWYGADGRWSGCRGLRGRGQHRIDYRHVIDWLVRKPGAFAAYRYRDDLFPTSRVPHGLRRAGGDGAGASGPGVPGDPAPGGAGERGAASRRRLRRLLDGDEPRDARTAVADRLRRGRSTPATVPDVDDRAGGPERCTTGCSRAKEGTDDVEDDGREAEHW